MPLSTFYPNSGFAAFNILIQIAVICRFQDSYPNSGVSAFKILIQIAVCPLSRFLSK